MTDKADPMTRLSTAWSQGPAAAARGGLTGRGLGWLILACTIVLGVVGGSCLTRPSDGAWAAVVLGALGLWAGWLYWRTTVDDRDVPAHLLHPFVGGVIGILLVHLLIRGGVDARSGRVQLLGSGDVSVMTRMMALALLVLLAQDVLGRVRHVRWLLTALGLALAGGAVLRLLTAKAVPGAMSVTMGGFVGVGMLMAPALMPEWSDRGLDHLIPAAVRRFGIVARSALAAGLGGVLIVGHDKGALAAIGGAGAAGIALLLAGAILPAHRRRVLAIGAHPVSLDRPVGESEDSCFGEFIEDSGLPRPEKAAGNELLRDRIEALLKTLTYREREIIRLRYGLGDGYTYTLEEVGKIFKVTRERVRQVEAKAIRKLQHPVRSRKLEGFLDTDQPEEDEE
ncbi:hypothetical protein LCGC14_2158540 [marine sediment metagenome]|uniref:RNA polymerase sigma-70 domain-containing protein n=1 Tax=marine sediment metagenome TaxID=412755 RepID=A0A0F9EFN5_9ZZZZ